MIVCHCAGVTDRDLIQVIADGADTVREVTRRCGAGRHCEPCRADIARLLKRDCPGDCPADCLVEAAA